MEIQGKIRKEAKDEREKENTTKIRESGNKWNVMEMEQC